MVREEAAQPQPLGYGLRGSWIELVPVAGPEVARLDEFDDERRLNPAMGGGGRSSSYELAPAMLIKDLRTGETVGVVENHPLPGRVTVYVIYLNEKGRPGFGLEATGLYLSHLFDQGARLVSMEVLSFNTAVTGMMRTARWPVQARLREQIYAAGRFWDLLVYSIDRDTWVRYLEHHKRRMPGGDRRPAALAGRAGDQSISYGEAVPPARQRRGPRRPPAR